MFNTGTRVIVLNSSLSGKIGPKRGSVGYIRNVNFDEALRRILFDDENLWFIRQHSINFVRYGLEQNTRMESRFFISIVPYLTDVEALSIRNGDFSMDEMLDKKIKRIEKLNPSTSKVVKRMQCMIADRYGKKAVHVGMLAPMLAPLDILSYGPADLAAWIRCFINDKHLADINRAMRTKADNISDAISIEILEIIREMRIDPKFRDAYLNTVSNSKVLLEELVLTLRKMCAIGERPARKKRREKNINWINLNPIAGKLRREINTMGIILNDFYTNDREIYTTKVLNNEKKGGFLEYKIKFLAALDRRNVSLARSIEEEAKALKKTVNR